MKTGKNIEKLLYVVLSVFIIITLIKELISINIKNIVICISSLIIFRLPYIIEKKFKIKIPSIFKISIFLFSFSSQILGEINKFYYIIPYWDVILHTVSGFISASIGISLIRLLNKKLRLTILSPIFVILFSLCFSMAVGITWEIIEYSSDTLFKSDMQTDEYINSIKSLELDKKDYDKVIIIDEISYAILYNKSNEEIAKLNNYLDIGLHDTMQDLIVNVIGAFIFCIFVYLYMINKEKYKFVEHFIIER